MPAPRFHSLRNALLAAFFAAASIPSPAQESPVTLSVWARVLFGEDGKVRESTLIDEDRYPAKFAENVKARIARASIQAPLVDGKPATMRTGMELRFTTTAEGTKIAGITMSPIPLKREFELTQKDAPGTWQGDLSANCVVSPQGQCGAIEVAPVANLPEELRRYMKTALERLRFEPQEIGGKPVEGEYVHRVAITTTTANSKDFRDQRRVFDPK
jgi:hypothetical protein